MLLPPPTAKRIHDKLERLYGDNADDCAERLARLLSSFSSTGTRSAWSEHDVILVAYGDHVHSADEAPLRTLGRFLHEQHLAGLLSTVHVLPFFPFSSDDGFSISDYRAVNPALGTWSDINSLGEDYDLQFDLVLNHCSQQHAWFKGFLQGDSPYKDYFVNFSSPPDTSSVVRARSSPLLTPFDTGNGRRYVWTTFSEDQVDLDYRNPDVLLEMLDVMLFYVQQGARILRLDAIAYIWKEHGTPCVNRPEVYLLVKLMRDILDAVAPGTLLLTETNLPYQENTTYWGDGDGANLIYQFSLPPLLLEAFVSGDASTLRSWLKTLGPMPPGSNVVNFTASHDGIGLRPAEGLIPRERQAHLIDRVRERGGLVSTRRDQEGESAYELNATWYSAITDPKHSQALREACFLASQAIMLGLQGIPAIYFSSLVGAPNDEDVARQGGRARTINRSRFALPELERLTADDKGGSIFHRYREMLGVRTSESCFHPDASQHIIEELPSDVLAWRRTSVDGTRTLSVVANISPGPKDLQLDWIPLAQFDLLTSESVDSKKLSLAPYQVCWLVPRSKES